MRIIFVRHGHPDYEKDCLTDLGHLQAEACAKRLSEEKITKFFSSSCGRAYETAEHIAAPLKMEIEKCDFMREIQWGSKDGDQIFKDGHPWYVADDMVSNGQDLMDEDWEHKEPFIKNKVTDYVQNVIRGFDRWLASLGYERDGLYYRVHNGNPDTVLMASHGGSSSAVLSRLFNLNFPFICASLKPDFTSVTIVSLEGENGSLISPIIEVLNDARHIAHICVDAKYGQ